MHAAHVAVVIVAAGRGSRAASARGVKQYVDLGGETVLARAASAFLVHPAVGRVQVVIHRDDAELYHAAMASVACRKLAPPVTGGETRQESVRLGLEAIERAGGFDAVLIHDAARPFITGDQISAVIRALGNADGAILAIPVVDTLKRAEAGRDVIVATVPRAGLWRAQTPQGFSLDAILAAHRAAAASGREDFTDDASIAEAAGLDVVFVAGEEGNFKITDLSDLARAEQELSGMTHGFESRGFEQRTGTGFDVHAFAEGDHVVLCGIAIPFEKALSGHSDADVAMHALTDALYGAIADGDIGFHFPPSEPRWKGAASAMFLEHARDRVAARGGRIVNVDVTIICEAPKVGPHRDAMRARLAEILALDVGRVAVKATTTEQLGFAGRREGIAAMASATVALPGDT